MEIGKNPRVTRGCHLEWSLPMSLEFMGSDSTRGERLYGSGLIRIILLI